MPCGAVVDLAMFSDADLAEAYQWEVDGTPFDFTGYGLMMMIRKNPDDAEVFVALDSTDTGFGGIMFNDPDVDGKVTTFNIFILRDQTAQMLPGDYVQSLILVRPDGLREDIWHGAFTYTTGPTR
jgi:hypothetical protein